MAGFIRKPGACSSTVSHPVGQFEDAMFPSSDPDTHLRTVTPYSGAGEHTTLPEIPHCPLSPGQDELGSAALKACLCIRPPLQRAGGLLNQSWHGDRPSLGTVNCHQCSILGSLKGKEEPQMQNSSVPSARIQQWTSLCLLIT